MNVFELNLDGLVGPTHHYAGLSEGNVASTNNAKSMANPKAAALQGLQKMRYLHDFGFKQGLLPPHQRPNLQLLYELGFTGSPVEQISKANKTAPELLSACYSASSMWTANAATVSPSADTLDHKIHFTAANLINNLHRCQEAAFSKVLLETLFANPRYFQHHDVLPRTTVLGDEGAANHNRLTQHYGEPGINLFVYGKKALSNSNSSASPKRYPARQTLEASQAVARNHLLPDARVIFACQNPEMIDAGVFHNDVISVANESVFLVHEQAFVDQKELLQTLKSKADFPLHILEIPQSKVSVEDAVATYLFNSQLLTLPDTDEMMLLSPVECQTNPKVNQAIEDIISQDNPVNSVRYMDLKQSMRNGGGPACLRLRVVMREEELQAMHQGVLVTPLLLDTLEQWINRHYRSSLLPADLADPALLDESFHALDELSQILKLGSIYPFQQN